nr:hypothetical protein [Citrobacter freundii]
MNINIIKTLFSLGVLTFSYSVIANDATLKSESDLVNNAIKSGYQAQRNLAFDYQTGDKKFGGSGIVQKDETKSCAWRKILLIANPEQVDASDPMNERFSCKNLDFKQDEQVWEIVREYLPKIEALKASGGYMVKSEKPTTEDKIEIIDVDAP